MLADLCLTAQPERISAVGHSHVALSFSRDQEAEASGTPREIGRDRGSDERRVAHQPRQRRPAARRRSAGGVAPARHRGVDRRVASRRVRHRGRRRRDPGRGPARIARGSPRVRSVAVRRSAVLLVTAFAVGLLAAFAASCAGNGVKGGLPQSSADDLKAQISDVGRSSSTAATATASTDSCARCSRRSTTCPSRPTRRSSRTCARAPSSCRRRRSPRATRARDDAADPDADGAAARRSPRRSRP